MTQIDTTVFTLIPGPPGASVALLEVKFTMAIKISLLGKCLCFSYLIIEYMIFKSFTTKIRKLSIFFIFLLFSFLLSYNSKANDDKIDISQENILCLKAYAGHAFFNQNISSDDVYLSCLGPAKQGWASALTILSLGYIPKKESQPEIRLKQRLDFALEAAQQGDRDAQWMASILLLKNNQKASDHWLYRSALQGHPMAIYGMLVRVLKSIEKDKFKIKVEHDYEHSPLYWANVYKRFPMHYIDNKNEMSSHVNNIINSHKNINNHDIIDRASSEFMPVIQKSSFSFGGIYLSAIKTYIEYIDSGKLTINNKFYITKRECLLYKYILNDIIDINNYNKTIEDFCKNSLNDSRRMK